LKEYAGNVIVPNYSESSVDVIGDASEVKQLYETKFDFNKIIPMPEPLHIDGNGDETKCANCKEWTNLKCDSESYDDSQRICGVCKIRSNIGGRIDGDDENEWTSLNEHEKKVAMEWRDKYGTASWYDWSIKNWGTKWPASEYYDDGLWMNGTGFHCEFNTPWDIPYPIFIEASKKWKTITITVWAEHEGEERAWEYEFKNGKMDKKGCNA